MSKARVIGSLRRATTVGSLLLLGACASIAQDNGFATVQDFTRDTLKKDVRWIKSDEDVRITEDQIATILKEPLTVDGAVQLALLNNRGLQAAFYGLGISAAQMVEAITPPNPTFSFSRLKGERLELERALTIDLLSLITLPLAAMVEDRRWEQAKLAAADQVLQIAADTRRAYYRAISSAQLLTYMEQTKAAAEASAEMGRRLGQTGAFGKLRQAREYVFYAETMAQLVRARQSATADRERLVRMLGLWGKNLTFTLPERLPDLPSQLTEIEGIEGKAIDQRMDIRMAKLEVEGLARSYSLTQATRFINVLEGGLTDRRETGEPKARGYEISLSIPIFDFGTTKAAHAENVYMQAVNHLSELAVNARSEVRESYETWRSNYDLALHYQRNVVPARSVISEEQLLQYNGMLVGVFELLADARDQIAAVMGSIQAQRDFWVADADLQAVMLSGGGRSMQAAGDAMTPRASGAAPH